MAQSATAAEAAPAASCSTTAFKPTKSGKTVYWRATASCKTTLTATLAWSNAGPDVAMGTIAESNSVAVSSSRLCNWGLPQNRLMKTNSYTPTSHHFSSATSTTSYGSSC